MPDSLSLPHQPNVIIGHVVPRSCFVPFQVFYIQPIGIDAGVPASRVVHLGGQTTGIMHTSRKRLPPYLFEARRRYFLKNRGVFYAAMADAATITGLALWRLRVMLTGKKDSTPSHLLRDTSGTACF